MKNILGDEVEPRKISTEWIGNYWVILFRDKKAIGFVFENGWTGKSMLIDFNLKEPVLELVSNEKLSFKEISAIMDEWNKKRNENDDYCI